MLSPKPLRTALLLGIGWLIWSAAAWADSTPALDTELTVDGWWVVGPFLSGVREAGVDPLYFAEGAPDFESPLLRPSFPSVLVPGGEARWRYYGSGEGGRLSVDYPEVPEASMQLVTDEWGFAGANTVGYAYAKLEVTGGPKRALLELKGAGMIAINGTPWPGDPYGSGMGMQPVLLEDGLNELKVAFSRDFSLRFLPVESDLQPFIKGATLPDAVRGEMLPRYFGLPVANCTTEWIEVTGATIHPPKLFGECEPLNVRIPPLCVANLALRLADDPSLTPPELAEDKLNLTVELKHDGGGTLVVLALDVRNADQPRRVTFISEMDRSVQYYGLLPPSDFDPTREYGLILSLHGAGVEAIGQVSSYQPKDWAYVAAPTNRRPFGFDWQDWGQRDMLEVLAEVERTCQINENRVHLTGHSMGGHGTWLNALTFPGLWATAAPSAGWTRFDLYSPMFLRRNVLYGDPQANFIWQLAMRQDDPLALCENALNLPIYAIEGGADDNVPPQQPRLMVERLRQLGYDITYEEVPGMGHWWDDPSTPGIDCIDSPRLNEFWKSHVRNPWPKEVSFISADLSSSNSAYWVCIPFSFVRNSAAVIHAKVLDRHTIRVDTNANYVQLRLTDELVDQGLIDLYIGEQNLTIDLAGPFTKEGIVTLYHGYIENDDYIRAWRVEETRSSEWPHNWDIDHGSPWPALLQRPFLLVYGTQGSEPETEWNLQQARLYSFHWWYRGNGRTGVLDDEQYLQNVPVDNVIAIGGFETNKVAQLVLDKSAIQIAPGGLKVYGQAITGPDLSYKFTQSMHEIPNVDEGYSPGLYVRSMLIEGGTSLKARQRLPAMMGIYSGAGLPDWIVWDDEVKLKGLGGVLAMGCLGRTSYNLYPVYFNEDLINRRAAGW